MSDQAPHLTRSHLLRRLLQRRVESLEAENVALKEQIGQLEQRLAHSTSRHAALPGNIAEAVTQTMEAVRAIGTQAQAEADFTVKVALHRQERLLAELDRLADESARLQQTMTEAVEGVRALEEQARTSVALLVKEASLHQEQLTSHLEGLYDAQGTPRVAVAEAQRAVLRAQEQAQVESRRLTEKAGRERVRLLARVAQLEQASATLRAALLQSVERAQAIGRLAALETAHAIQARVEPPTPPATRTAPPAETPRAPAERAPRPRPHRDHLILEEARAAILAAAREGESSPPHPDEPVLPLLPPTPKHQPAPYRRHPARPPLRIQPAPSGAETVVVPAASRGWLRLLFLTLLLIVVLALAFSGLAT